MRKYKYFSKKFSLNRIKYTEEMKCINHVILLEGSYEAWLKGAILEVLGCKLEWVTFCGSNTGAFEEKILINNDKS